MKGQMESKLRFKLASKRHLNSILPKKTQPTKNLIKPYVFTGFSHCRICAHAASIFKKSCKNRSTVIKIRGCIFFAVQVLLDSALGCLGRLLSATWTQLGGSWGALGLNLSALGHLLDPTWSLLGASWSQLGRCWAPLGPNLEPLGANLDSRGVSWSQLGRSWAPLGPNLEPLGRHLERTWTLWGTS